MPLWRFRKNIGIGVLAVSAGNSLAHLLRWMRPLLLRMRVHGGLEHTLAVAIDSLTVQFATLVVGAVLAFWPERPRR